MSVPVNRTIPRGDPGSVGDQIVADLRDRGFARFTRTDMLPLATNDAGPDDWSAFARSWDDLALDEHMADGGRYRRRRHAVFHLPSLDAQIVRAPHRAHFQTREFNPLNGGTRRWFAPITLEFAANPIFTSMMRAFISLATHAAGPADWDIEVHQFRITADVPCATPTPEGVHRDGVDIAFIVLVSRTGVSGGVTRLLADDGQLVSNFTMASPGECVMLNDRRLRHGVSPIDAEAHDAYRDTLVVTFSGRK